MKLCIAGLNSIRSDTYAILKDIPYVLESFYYIRDYEIPLIKSCDLFLLDSGAFSFMNSNLGHVDIEKYLDDYIAFINKHDVKYFFELDIDSVVGLKEVERLRKKLEDGTGKKCIPVWHFSRGKEYFIKMCQEYDYVAFGGIITDGIPTKKILKYLPWFVKTAHQYGARIHALGLTCKGIEKFGLDSADSTSWNSISRFGSLYKFDGEKIVNITPKNKRIDKSKYNQGEVHNLKEWIKFQKYCNR